MERGADCHKCRPQTEVENNVFDSVSGRTTLYLEMTKKFKGEYEIIDINPFLMDSINVLNEAKPFF